MKDRILIVEDEETLCEVLRFNLEEEGYVADCAFSAEEALTKNLQNYQLVILDIMMGEISGTQLVRILKSNPATSGIAVIFCTAKDTEDDIVTGLELGADDYIVKPYSLKNVIARVRSVLRRVKASSSLEKISEGEISFEGLQILPDKKICVVDGEEVALPKKEFEILLKLMSNINRVFSREDIIHDIWPEEVVVVDRVVDVNVARIRQKIGEYGKHLKSRSGYGYGFME